MNNVFKNLPHKRKTVGLALGSGGARGLAHIGVLKCLTENNIPIDYISGSSIGAWIGAMYALDTDLDKIADTIEETRKRGLALMFDPSMRGGFVKGEKIIEVISDSLRESYFEETVIPLRIIATELVSGKEVSFNSGLIQRAVRASISVPSVFLPYAIGEMLLVDGGVCNPVPVSTVKEMGADVVIAVNLDNFRRDGLFDKEKAESVARVTQRSVKLLRHYLALRCCDTADFVIEPKNSYDELSKWRNLIMKDGISEQSIALGFQATMEIIPQIKKLLNM